MDKWKELIGKCKNKTIPRQSQTKIPTHPGVILSEHYIKPLNINITAFAVASGISEKTLSEILIEKASITAEIAVKISKVLKTSPELWINLQKNFDTFGSIKKIT